MGVTLSGDSRYVILVRHASRDIHTDYDESRQSMSGWDENLGNVVPDYKVKGLRFTLAVAHRLAEELASIETTRIWHSPHMVASQTANVYRRVLGARQQHSCMADSVSALDPDSGSAAKVADSLRKLTTSDRLEAGSAIIVVGHQPMLTSLARDLTLGKLPAGTLPLGGSEAACLEMNDGQGATLLWMLTSKSSQLMRELKEKIRSKYDVAKFFLGAFVVNTGFVLSGEIWDISNPSAIALVFAGFILTLIALALTAATLISYDALLMPTEFWNGASVNGRKERQPRRPQRWSVQRPPSQAHVVLFYEMVHIWTVFFIPALACAFAAIAAFLVALAHDSFYPHLQEGQSSDVELKTLIVITIVAAGALVLPLVFHYRRNRPNLGFED